MEHRLMTDDEKVEVFMRSHELRQAGKIEEAKRVHKTMPMPPFLAKIIKEKVGADFLVQQGYNLAEAEAKFGKDWLNR